MCKSIKTGDQWAHLVCLDTGYAREQIADTGPFGAVSEIVDINRHRLQCECGKVFTVDVSACPGKRALKDCGCGLGVIDGMTFTISVYGPASLMMEIGQYATQAHISTRHAFTRLVESGLQRMDIDPSDARPGEQIKGLTTRSISMRLIELLKAQAEDDGVTVNKTIMTALESGLVYENNLLKGKINE